MADRFKKIAKGGWNPAAKDDPYNYGANEPKKHGIRENFKGVNKAVCAQLVF